MKSSSRSSARNSRRLPVELGSLLVFGSALFTLCALVSFNPADQSLSTLSTARPTNLCGVAGAYVADIFIQTVGLGSFLVPIGLFFGAVALHYREGLAHALRTIVGVFIAAIAFTVALTLQWPEFKWSGSPLLTGGALGFWVSEVLRAQFNVWGGTFLALGFAVATLVISTPLQVSKVIAALTRATAVILWRISRLATQLAFYGLASGAALAAKSISRRVSVWKLQQAALKSDRAIAHKVAEENDSLKDENDETGVQVSEPASLGVILKEPPLNYSIPVQEEFLEVTAKGASVRVDTEKGQESDVIDVSQLRVSSSDAPSGATALGAMPIIIEERKDTTTKSEKKRASRPISVSANWKLPSLEFLKKAPRVESHIDKQRLYENSEILKAKLKDFDIEGEVTEVKPGPVITLYKFKPAAGIKISKIASLADDLAMALAAEGLRVIAPLPGEPVVGVEIPNEKRETVFFRELIENTDFFNSKEFSIPVVVGKDISGEAVLADLIRMPHLLVAGQTGSGKSVFMNGLICSLLYRFTPEEMRLILVDPKFVEFQGYRDLPHLLLPVVDDAKHASTALKWAVHEMERRYRILQVVGAKNLQAYNEQVKKLGPDVIRDLLNTTDGSIDGKPVGGDWHLAFDSEEGGEARVTKLPNIVIIIDELADLMLQAKKDVETSISRITAKARAAGIHLVIATQRPSTDVVTGLIKSNLPTRISFRLKSQVDSRTILDSVGAEKLLGRGDMLYISAESPQVERLHGSWVSDEEIGKIVSFLKSQGEPHYRNEILVDEDEEAENAEEAGGLIDADEEMFVRCVEYVKQSRSASASMLQRQFRIGYNRAARIVELMERRGIVGPAEGSRPREVLVS